MTGKVYSMGISGIEGYPVLIDCYIGTGLPGFDLVGLPDASVKEARERVRAAVKTSGYRFPVGRITVDDRLVFQRLAGDEKRRIREQVLELFAEEAVRVVSGMPKWKPGVRNGIPMKVEYELPINFKIDYGIHEMG